MPSSFKDLAQARAAMTWRVAPGRFALLGFAEAPQPEDCEAIGETGQLIREGGETSLLVESSRVPDLQRRHPDARVETDLAWIRFEGAMEWELVGFLALVTGELAAAEVPLGAICGYSRDHLFVAERYLETTRSVLTRLFGEECSEAH